MALSVPDMVSVCLWIAWVIGWVLAARWSKPTAATPPALQEAVHRLPTFIGYGLIFAGAHVRIGSAWHAVADTPLWRLSGPASWSLTALVAAGLGFTAWARWRLGAYWSSGVARKDDHRIIEIGPYRLVRHPIYTGLLAATLAVTGQIATAAAVVGLVLVIIGLALKARQERFLSQELGEAAYEGYRRRVPMLVPFWPMRG